MGKFQFLMVRLKGLFTHLKFICYPISIPYGAIKSMSGDGFLGSSRSSPFLMSQFKAVKTTLTRPIILVFQFLMVRLKVGLLVLVVFCLNSFQFLMVRLKVQAFRDGKQNWWWFQFLMVRLKGLNFKYITNNNIKFQLLMVRLKDLISHLYNIFLVYFNSLWCD